MTRNPVGTPHRTPRAHLFDLTFWQVLPAHCDKIDTRWDLIVHLYHEASAAPMATDRAAGTTSLKAELEMVEQDIQSYRDIVKGIELEDITGVYLVAGRQRWRAEQLAKEDLQGLMESLRVMDEKVREVKADTVYGFQNKN